MKSFWSKVLTLALMAVCGNSVSAEDQDPAPQPRIIDQKISSPESKPKLLDPPTKSSTSPSVLPTLPESTATTTKPLAPYPGYGYGFAQGELPPRLVYGPSVSPNEYPYYSHPLYGQTPAQVGIASYRHPRFASLHRW